MSQPEDFSESYFDTLKVSLHNIALYRSADVSGTAISDTITGTTMLGTHIALIGQDYPRRKGAQGIEVTLRPYDDQTVLEQEWTKEGRFYLESDATRNWDVRFSDSMQKLLKDGRTAAVEFNGVPPTAKLYYRPEHNLGPPVIPESWGIECRITHAILSALANDIRSGLHMFIDVDMRLNPLLRSHSQNSIGLLPYNEHGFDSLGWLEGLGWTIRSRRSRTRRDSGDSKDASAAGESYLIRGH